MRERGGDRRLFAFDFDGTLSPIVPVRSEARLHPACRALLGDLARIPGAVAAILSSRALDDLIPRVPVRGLFLGGGSGLEWRFPLGRRVPPGIEITGNVERARERLSPPLAEISKVPGAEVEDKRWSIAVHFRNTPPEARSALGPPLDVLRGTEGIRVFDGPDVAEIQLVPGWDKAEGLKHLCRRIRFDPSGGGIVYAGDDENDAAAMRWALSRGGTALAVGPVPRVSGARTVTGPDSLAGAVRSLLARSARAGKGMVA